MTDNKKRVIVIGLDGADYELIKFLVENGDLPTFRILFNEGFYARLKATIPPFTAPSWTTITTGVNPGKHGIFDFARYDAFLKMTVNTSKDVKAPRLWDILGKFDMKSIIINCPITYPVNKIKGVMISGMDTPELNTYSCYPRDLYDFLRREGYKIDIDHSELNLYKVSNPHMLVNKLNKIALLRHKISMKIMNKFDWDFTFILFNESDRVLHYCYNNIELVRSHFRVFDTILKKIIDNYSNKATIIVVSDHGFDLLHYKFYPNNMLYDLKLLQLNREAELERSILWKYRMITTRNFSSLVLKALFRFPIFSKKFLSIIEAQKSILDVVSTESKALYPPPYSQAGFRINNTIDDDKEEIITIIIEKLKEINEQSEKPILAFFRREEIYEGAMVKKAPEVIVMPYAYITESTQIVHPKSLNNLYLSKIGFLDKSGDHASVRSRDNAILIMYGREISNKEELQGATVLDIVPTILKLYGMQMPSYIEGRPLL